MRFSKEEKTKWLEGWRQSGKNAHRYAKENGLIPWTFIRWTKEEAEASQRFVEVPVQSMLLPGKITEILIEKGELKIHVPVGLGGKDLRSVMEGIGAML